jgi:hypothetical protein
MIRNQLFGKLAAAMAALAFLGLQALAIGAEAPQVVPEAEGQTDSPAGAVVAVDLGYREVGYSFINWSVPMTTRSEAFKKEPVLSQGKVIRGTLRLGRANEETAFAWDRTAGKLYLDLNLNQDLTDDPGGVLTRQAGSRDYYQTFTNIHLPFKTLAGAHKVLLDLNFYDYGKPNCSAAMRWLWEGKLTLQGEEWQVSLIENRLDQSPSLEASNLLLRRWSERNQSFSAQLYNDSSAAFPFSQKLFFGNRAYRLKRITPADGDSAGVRLQFAEERPKLGELKITGDYVHRLTMQGQPYRVVVDQPAGAVKVPTGSYAAPKVWLKKGQVEAYLEERGRSSAERITIDEKKPAILVAGGPLTNSVSIARRGRYLSMNYQLVGAGGPYQLANQDRSHPPELVVYHGEKKVGSGKFEFG